MIYIVTELKISLNQDIFLYSEDVNGIQFAATLNPVISTDLIRKLQKLQKGGLSCENVVRNIRVSLFSDGYPSYLFRKDTPESPLYKMNILATCINFIEIEWLPNTSLNNLSTSFLYRRFGVVIKLLTTVTVQ